MDKKYELLLNDTIEYKGKILYRIKALKNFGHIYKGVIGGYIESEKNLSHSGECWIYNKAKVYDNARVYENARVYGNAEAYENATIYGNSTVYEWAEAYGDSKVYENAEIYEDAKVYDNAEVSGDSKVYGAAEVYEKAEVYGNAGICGDAKVYGNSKVCGYAEVCEDAKVYGRSKVCGYAVVSGNAVINKGNIIGDVSIPFKDIFQHQCENRLLTAILTEDDEILYTIGYQENITEEEFLDSIYNEDGGLEENPHRKEYLKLIPLIKMYFKGE